MKIRTLLKDEYGRQRATGLGNIKFDSEGIADVEPEVGKRLCAISTTLELVDEKGGKADEKGETTAKGPVSEEKVEAPANEKPEPTPEVISDELEITPEIKDDNEDQPVDDEEIEVLREVLNEKTIAELREICEESKVEGYEVFKGPQGKKELVEFMVSKKVGL